MKYIKIFDNFDNTEEEIQMYIDILSDHAEDPAYNKYKVILKNKYNVDFDNLNKDQIYINTANLLDIKPKEDFLSFNNYMKYATIISSKRGFINPLKYQTPYDINIDDIIIKISKELEFNSEKKEYIETNKIGGDIGSVFGNTMYYTDYMDLYYLIHELGHIYQFKTQYNGIAGDPAYSSTKYGTTNFAEAFAENFAIYFINPDALKTWNKFVYDEIRKCINYKWEKVIKKLIEEAKLKTNESFYKYKDFINAGAEHKVYYIDDDWLLKMPKISDYITNQKRLQNFNNHIYVLNKYPEIFVNVKKLDKYRASVEKVDTELATEEIKYFYKKLISLFNEDDYLDTKYFTLVNTNGYTDILFKIINQYHKFKELFLKFKEYAVKRNYYTIIKWCDFIEKIEKSKVKLETDYLDAKSWNFGIDKNNNIKMIDF